uniref:Protein quiver n=1 Tax=Panagrolaimus superbus TaxID=310955 RepID=A0A914Z1K2_9BILA
MYIDRKIPDLFPQPGYGATHPCESSCIKAVLKSQNAKIIFRGCLTSVYQQISARDYSFSMPPVGSCDEQEHSSKHIGTTVTQTCLCSTNYCNGALSFFYSLYIKIFYYCILYIIICIFLK